MSYFPATEVDMGKIISFQAAHQLRQSKLKEIGHLLDFAFDADPDPEVRNLKKLFFWEHETQKIDLKLLVAGPLTAAIRREMERNFDAMPVEDARQIGQAAYLCFMRETGQRLHCTWTYRESLPWITDPAERHAKIMPCLERLAFVWHYLAHPQAFVRHHGFGREPF